MTLNVTIFMLRALAPPLRNTAGALLVGLAFAIPVSNALTSVLAVAFTITVVLGLLVGSWRGQWDAAWRHPVGMASMALFGSVLLAALWSPATPEAVGGQLARNASLLLLPLFAVVVQDGNWARRCLLAFSAAMVVTLMLSFAHALWAQVGAGAWPLPYKGGGDAIFHVHITHNVLMSVAVLVWLGQSCAGRSLRPAGRVGLAVLAALGVFNILWMVPGRTGYATLLAGLPVLVFVCCPRRWLVHSLVAIVAVSASAIWMSDTLQGRLDRTWREIQAFEGANSVQRGDVNLADHRLAIWREAWKVVEQRPLAGHGTGSYRSVFCASAQPSDMCLYGGGKHPHNQWLFTAIEAGMLGVACYAAWVAALGYAFWRRRADGAMGAIGPGLWMVWMVYGLVDTPLQLLTERHFFPLFFAMLLFSRRASDGTAKPTP